MPRARAARPAAQHSRRSAPSPPRSFSATPSPPPPARRRRRARPRLRRPPPSHWETATSVRHRAPAYWTAARPLCSHGHSNLRTLPSKPRLPPSPRPLRAHWRAPPARRPTALLSLGSRHACRGWLRPALQHARRGAGGGARRGPGAAAGGARGAAARGGSALPPHPPAPPSPLLGGVPRFRVDEPISRFWPPSPLPPAGEVTGRPARGEGSPPAALGRAVRGGRGCFPGPGRQKGTWSRFPTSGAAGEGDDPGYETPNPDLAASPTRAPSPGLRESLSPPGPLSAPRAAPEPSPVCQHLFWLRRLQRGGEKAFAVSPPVRGLGWALRNGAGWVWGVNASQGRVLRRCHCPGSPDGERCAGQACFLCKILPMFRSPSSGSSFWCVHPLGTTPHRSRSSLQPCERAGS